MIFIEFDFLLKMNLHHKSSIQQKAKSMPIIKIEMTVKAPIQRVFDLARCIDLHEETMLRHREKAVAGVTEGLMKLGESVTWEATYFGVRQKLTSKIVKYHRPYYFRDEMIKGAFKRFDHDHFFEENIVGTLMKDVFDYDSPFNFLGKIADALFLENYMRKMLTERSKLIKKNAEGDDWQKYI